jgi:hypothetical protein
MSGVGPNVLAFAALTTGVGFVMVRMGVLKGMLHGRSSRRRCPSCGRLLSPHGCDRCGH